MSFYPMIQPSEPKANSLLVCPSNWDGMVCSVILMRHLKNVEYPLYSPMEDITAVLDFPAIQEGNVDRDLVIAGFPMPDALVEKTAGLIHKSSIAGVRWYSHHFWHKDIARALLARNVELINDPGKISCSDLLISQLGITDQLSVKLAKALQMGIDPGNDLKDWFYLMLGASEDLYQIRHALAPLFEGNVESPDPGLVNIGREIYQSFENTIETSTYFEDTAGADRLIVIGLPLSLRPHYRLICSMIANRKNGQIVLMFMDSLDQILLIRGTPGHGSLDFLKTSELLEGMIQFPVRLYDTGMMLIGPVNDVQKDVESIIRALKSMATKGDG
jgi:hypothetical protein